MDKKNVHVNMLDI